MNKSLQNVFKPLALLLIAGLGACAIAPQHQRPPAPVPAVFPASPGAAATQPVSDLAWRDFFPDPQLQSLIETALSHNRDLRTAALRIEEARALYRIQSADLLPNVNLGASAARAHTPASLNILGREVTGGNFQIGLNLASFEIDYLGRVRNLRDAALAQYLATDEARQSAQIGIVAEVAKAALNERALAEQMDLAQKALEGREAALKLAQQRFDVGASSALDLRLNETLVLNARVAVVTLSRQRQQALNALGLLTGKAMSAPAALRSLDNQGIVAELSPGLPSDLLVQRPDIRAAEQRLRAANASIAAARAAFFPRISLTAGFGVGSNVLYGLFSPGSETWNFVPALGLPIFDAGRNEAGLNLAEVRKNIAVSDYEKTIQVAFREVADSLVARGSIDEQVQAQRAVLAAQQDRLRLAEQRHRGGVSNFIEVLDAQRDVFSAEQALVQIRLLRLTNSVDLYRALGGGLK